MEYQYNQRKVFTFRYIFLMWSAKNLVSVIAAPADLGSEERSGDFWSSNHAWPFGFLVLVTSLVLLGFALMVCMDCMNSEVSSESHPASMSSAPKWGGATNYRRAGNGNGGADSCFISEEINPENLRNAPLPYSMVPTQIPEAAEFRGYEASGGNSGMIGYSVTTPSAPSNMPNYGAHSSPARYSVNGSGTDGRHYNPAERDDPPPAYSETGYH